MADIRITPASSVMAFTSSLNYKQTITQDASGSIVLQGSGSINRTNLFAVDGNNGRLFSIDDDLSDSLFSVNTIAGLPVIEAFANNTVVIGQYGQNVLVVTGSRVGIGTSSPLSKLMFGDGETSVDAIRMGYTGRYGIGFNTNTGGYFNIFAHKDASKIAFGFDTGTYGTFSEKFSISATGAATFSSSVTATSFVGALTGTAATATNVAYSGLTGTVPTWNQNTTGNAATATILQTARNINGVSFNGSANITVADSTKLPLAGGTMTGEITNDTDGQGITFNGGARVYKKSGTGLMVRLHAANVRLQAENNAGTILGTYAYTSELQTIINGTGFVKASGTTLSYDNSTYVPTSRTLAINGTTLDLSSNRSFSVGTVTGTGTLYKIAKVTSTGTAIGDSMIYDSGTYVGIGTTMPNAKLDIVDTMAIPTLRIAYVPAGGYGGGGNIDFVGGFGDYVSGNISWKNGTTVKAQIGYSTTGVMTLKAPSTIDLQTVSTSRIYIYSTGGVGIGTTLPGSKLSVGLRASVDGNIRLSAAGTGTNAGASLLWDMQVGGGAAISHLAEIRPESYATGANKNILNFYVGLWNNSADSGTAKMTIAENGNVGIGTINPLKKLDIVSSTNDSFDAIVVRPTNQTQTLNIGWEGIDASYNFIVKAGGSERMRITNTGNIGINTSNPGYPLHVNANVSGTSIYASADIVAYSDQSVKENIRPIENVIERIQQSRGVLYDRTDIETKDNIGFIAQELEVAFPELVVTNEDGTKAVKYQNAVAVLFEAIKEQQKQIDAILKLLDNGTSK